MYALLGYLTVHVVCFIRDNALRLLRRNCNNLKQLTIYCCCGVSRFDTYFSCVISDRWILGFSWILFWESLVFQTCLTNCNRSLLHWDCNDTDPCGILEIKCPYKYHDVDPAGNKDFCRWHSYTQKEPQLLLSDSGTISRKWCDFLMYTNKKVSVERVSFDEWQLYQSSLTSIPRNWYLY